MPNWKFWQTPKQKLLPSGDPVLKDEDRNNLELSAKQVLGNINIMPSRQGGGYAVFAHGVGTITTRIGVETHNTDEALKPYTYSVGESIISVPALMRLPQRGMYDFQLIVSCHPVDTTSIHARYEALREGERNQAYLTTLDLLEKWDSPRLASAQARNLWLVGNKDFIHPNLSGSGGLGGRTMRYTEAGHDLYMLINGRSANHMELTNGGSNNLYPLEYACPEIVEHSDHLVVEGTPQTYFRGGQMSSDMLRALQQMPVDILIRLEFIKGTNKLFTTALIRVTASPTLYKSHAAQMQHLIAIQEQLKDKGGWKRITGKAQMDAFRRFLPGNPPLPSHYGRREVTGWSRVEEPKGILQLLSEGLSPVGDPTGNFTVGFIGTYPYRIDDELAPSYLVTGTSKRTGKTATVASLVLKRSKNVVWVDFTSSPLDSTQVWGITFGGQVFDERLTEADEILMERNPSRRPTEKELADMDKELAAEDRTTITNQLEEALELWRKKGRITGLPWIYRPYSTNSVRFLKQMEILFELLPYYTQQYYLETGQTIQVVANDFSRLVELLKEGDARQQEAAQKAGAKILGYLNQGANAGISTWIITHTKEDPSHLVGREIYSDFSWHFDGGIDTTPTYRYHLVLPKTREIVANLNLRINDDDLLKIVGRLTSEELKAWKKVREANNHPKPNLNGKELKRIEVQN